jgi:Protein of unknown function (DUF402)
MTVIEVKRRLDGTVRTYPCEGVEVADGHAVLLYRITASGRVADVSLAPGTLTVAYYWTDRPYNVYHWIAPSGDTLAYYFNLSGPVRIGLDRVEWEDLEVDVLVTPDGRVQVLDEDAVPAAAAARLPEIARARERVLADRRTVVEQVERASRMLEAVPRLRGTNPRDARTSPGRR